MAEALRRSNPKTGRRYLLAVRAGDDSLHRKIIHTKTERNFDLLISYFGTVTDKYRDDGEYYHVQAGPPWIAYDGIMRDNPDLRENYDYVCFADDDLEADTASWNALFVFCDRHGFDLAQPAILGPISYPITAPVPHLLYRITTYVENMCPIFSKRGLEICWPSFGESRSGWGISHVWPKLLAGQGGRLGIIDSICVTHTRELRSGSLYRLLDDLGVDPTAERASVLARNGIEQVDIRELSRVYRMTPQAILYRLREVAKRMQLL